MIMSGMELSLSGWAVRSTTTLIPNLQLGGTIDQVYVDTPVGSLSLINSIGISLLFLYIVLLSLDILCSFVL